MNEQNSSAFDLQLDDMVTAKLKEAAKWSRYMVVVFYIATVLMILCGIMFLFVGASFEEAFREAMRTTPYGSSFGGIVSAAVFATIFIIMALIIGVLAVMLGKFSSKVKLGLQLNNQAMIAEGMSGLKTYFTISGVLGIITLVFSIIQVGSLLF